jgi:hypothetical protein
MFPYEKVNGIIQDEEQLSLPSLAFWATILKAQVSSVLLPPAAAGECWNPLLSEP